MEMKKIIEFFGKARTFAKAIGFSDFTVSCWKDKGEVPAQHREKAKKALKAHKRKSDKLFKELMK